MFYCGIILGELIAMLIRYKSRKLLVDTYDFYAGIVMCVFVGFIFLFLFILIIFQLTFISQNITTREYVKNKFLAGNPFDKGFCTNFSNFFREIDEYRRVIDYNDAGTSYKNELLLVENSLPIDKLIIKNEINDVSDTSDNSRNIALADKSINL